MASSTDLRTPPPVPNTLPGPNTAIDPTKLHRRGATSYHPRPNQPPKIP